jgi:hypothetical protein
MLQKPHSRAAVCLIYENTQESQFSRLLNQFGRIGFILVTLRRDILEFSQSELPGSFESLSTNVLLILYLRASAINK